MGLVKWRFESVRCSELGSLAANGGQVGRRSLQSDLEMPRNKFSISLITSCIPPYRPLSHPTLGARFPWLQQPARSTRLWLPRRAHHPTHLPHWPGIYRAISGIFEVILAPWHRPARTSPRGSTVPPLASLLRVQKLRRRLTL